MKRWLLITLPLFASTFASAQEVKRDVPYANPAVERQVLDIYTPKDPKNCPVVFWIHGGGWQTGDKSSVQDKPKAFTDRGFVFVSTNYRLLPNVEMGTIIRDVAKSLGWVHKHIAEYGGDPQRLLVMGHSAGAQLAALICIDDRYLKDERVPFDVLKGCVPVDGDTYDVPAIIEVAETRRRVHHLPPIKFGHREKFGNEPQKHVDFSAVTHVAKGKGIPPFLILHVAEHPDTTAQAQRLGNSLKEAGIRSVVFGAKDTNHTKINANIGQPDDPTSKALFEFVAEVVNSKESMPQSKSADVRWKMHSINNQSPYEACGAADFNGDGKIDIFCGDSWYEAPKWTRRKVREVPASVPNPHYYEDFCDAAMDVNGDGRPDIVTCNYFGKRFGWVENPGGDATKPWTEHEVDKPGNMETGELVDINGDGKLDFLPNPGNVVVWYELTQQKPTVVWTKHDLGRDGAGHGVGVGDVNGDGRSDILTPKGWYEQPKDSAASWPFHGEFQLGATGVLIHARDIDGDGLSDIVYGMGHDFGLFWLKQSQSKDGKREWTKQTIDDTFSQVHTLLFANIDGQGQPELITGKRVYAHEVEPGDIDSPVVLSFRFDRGSGKWDKQTIFRGLPASNAPKAAKDRWALKDFPPDSAGTGLQMKAIDIDGDGDVDLVCPGKSGLYLFENLGK